MSLRAAAPLVLAAACATPGAADARWVGPVAAVVALADGGAVACSQAGVRVEPADGAARVLVPPFRPFAVAACADGSVVVAGGGTPAASGEVALWTDGAPRHRRLADDLVYAVALAPARPIALAGDARGRVHVLAVPDLSEVAVLPDHHGPVTALCFLDGERWASASRDGVIAVRSLDRLGEQPLRIADHTSGVECLAARDGVLASGARDGKVRLHDAGSGRLLRTWARLGSAVTAVAWQGEGLLAGTLDGRVLSLDDDGSVRVRGEGLGSVYALAVAADGRALAGTVGALRAVP